MSKWTVIYSPKARKSLGKIPSSISTKIILKMREIASDPYELLEKMKESSYYKFRVGQYRGIIQIINDKLILYVIKVNHRSVVYKK